MQSHSIIPWQMRLEHRGHSHIELNWQRGNIHWNPKEAVQEGDVIILLGSWPEQLQGAIDSIQKGVDCHIVALPQILRWLESFGTFKGSSHFQEDGLEVVLEPYTGIADWTAKEGIRKGVAGMRKPLTAFRRLRQKKDFPTSPSCIAWVTFPSGAQLLHLNLALHQNIDSLWLQGIQEKAKNASWMMVGCDYEEQEAFLQHIVNFEVPHILLMDLVGDYRRQVGLPTKLLTPLADRAIEKNCLVQIFATQVTFRFDTILLCDRK